MERFIDNVYLTVYIHLLTLSNTICGTVWFQVWTMVNVVYRLTFLLLNLKNQKTTFIVVVVSIQILHSISNRIECRRKDQG